MTASATQTDSDTTPVMDPETDPEDLVDESDSDASTVILSEMESEPVVTQEAKRPRLR